MNERALKRWTAISWHIAGIFTTYPQNRIPLRHLYEALQTLHLRIPGHTYSEQAVRAVLGRFVKKGLLRVRRMGGRRSEPIYFVSEKGLTYFQEAIKLKRKWDDESSLDSGHSGLLSRANDILTTKLEIGLKPWRELIAFDSGWNEKNRITKIHLDPFIIKNIRNHIQNPSVTGAGWKTLNTKTFVLQVSKVRSVQLWVKAADWKIRLNDFLQQIPNLQNRHLDQFWNAVESRIDHQTIVREFHVSDPELSESNIQMKVKIEHGDGYPNTTMTFVKSHGKMEVEFGGTIKNVDNICVNLAGQFAAAATYQHLYEREMAKTTERLKREFEARLESEMTKLKEQLFKPKEETKEKTYTADYIG